jgi:hypothetical protein
MLGAALPRLLLLLAPGSTLWLLPAERLSTGVGSNTRDLGRVLLAAGALAASAAGELPLPACLLLLQLLPAPPVGEAGAWYKGSLGPDASLGTRLQQAEEQQFVGGRADSGYLHAAGQASYH